MSALEKHKAQEAWRKDNGKYIPKPSNWLRDERWKDEITNPQAEPDYPAVLAQHTRAVTEEEAEVLMQEIA